MITLALELSTGVAGIALLDGEKTLAYRSWREAPTARQHLFAILPELLKDAGVVLSQVEMFAVGLGPGQFTGLRIALTAVRAMAIPGNRLVYGVSSAEALALVISREFKERPVVTVGDARRQRLWYAVFLPGDPFLTMQMRVSLITPEELASAVPSKAVLVTPDWDRIGDLLQKSRCDDVTLIEENRTPTALAVATLATTRAEIDIPSEPLVPIYLHPPVAVKPENFAPTRLL